MFSWWLPLMGIGLFAMLVLCVYDVTQTRHAILRNYPVVGHLRYLLERIGPEFRQYIVAANDEERPFSRDRRSWVYASAKKENNYFGFGTDNDQDSSPNYLIIQHSAFPLMELHPSMAGYDPSYPIPGVKVLGRSRGRAKAFRPNSIVNVSGMSYGSLSSAAVEAINRGCKLANCLQNTGEGGISPYHRHGGDLIWQIGTGYFGCRDARGGFSIDRFRETLAQNPVRAIEVKLSQGAKPGMGGLLPASKVTSEIAQIRGIPLGQDCHSPARHTAFADVDGLLDFVELLADTSGLPVGIKSAVGGSEFWSELAERMATSDRGVDFITVDGGEGGTGAGPLVFTDHVAFPFKLAFVRVYREFIQRDLHDRVVFIGSGKLGFPDAAVLACALGCDMINVGREPMMAIGCIQAQKCHTGKCPTGVATQDKWLMRGLDPTDKSARLANYVIALRKEILAVSRACGKWHPSLITGGDCEILDERFGSIPVSEVFRTTGFANWGVPNAAHLDEMVGLMA